MVKASDIVLNMEIFSPEHHDMDILSPEHHEIATLIEGYKEHTVSFSPILLGTVIESFALCVQVTEAKGEFNVDYTYTEGFMLKGTDAEKADMWAILTERALEICKAG